MNLDRAITIATKAHRGQKEKNGRPYIEHPMRVMEGCTSTDARIAAVLHDVIEDSPGYTIDTLKAEGFSPNVITAVILLTKSKQEDYWDYLIRIKTNPIAREVKLADLRDNLDLGRIPRPTKRDLDRIEKYKNAMEFLKG